MKTFECEAIIFDMDGTLINTNECIEYVWKKWGEKYNIEIKEVLHGITALESLKRLAPHLATEEIAQELEDMVLQEADKIKLIPGAKELILKLPKDSWAIATSATIEIVNADFNEVGLPVPEKLVTAEKVQNSKPHPEPFIKAAELLGTTPDKCIVFEDSLSGIKAGYDSGATVIGLTTTYPEEELKLAKCTINDFSELDICIKMTEKGRSLIVTINNT